MVVVLFLVTASCKKANKPIYQIEHGYALGTTYTLKYEVASDTISYKNEIEELFNKVNRSISIYLPASDISKINTGDTTVVVDSYFTEVYLKAKEVWKKTDGRFDPTIGTLVNAWGFGPGKELKNVTPQQVDSMLEFTGFDKVELSEENKILKKHPSIFLNFNALGEGFTIDLIGKLFTQKGIKNYLIELGGEVLAKGINTATGKNWIVAIDHPVQKEKERVFIAKAFLKDGAMATSGNYRKFRIDEKTGKRYAHIINPKTGYPQQSNTLSVSVLAPTCMEADAYATSFMMMTISDIKKVLAELHYVEVYIVYTTKNNKIAAFMTDGFKALLKA